jgi:tRNA1Val (adenine37-N6)-methyltransferase
MKVTTDGCLFGAWVAQQISDLEIDHVLDIGTGTGLLSLMLAQQTNAHVDAVELNKEAYEKARTNFEASPWDHQIDCHLSDIQTFASNNSYDIIVCNPPFFSHGIKGKTLNKNQAIHSDSLPIEKLISTLSQNLNPSGSAYVMYPPLEMKTCMELASYAGMFPNQILKIRDKKDADDLRWIAQFSFNQSEITEDVLVIKEVDNHYTQAFIKLLKAYYLHL